MQCNGISYVRRCCHDDFTRLMPCLYTERDVMWIWFNWKLSRMENTPLRHSQPTNIRKIIFIVRLLLSVCVHSLWEKKIQIDWFPFEKRCIIADNSTFIVWNSIWNFFFFFFVNYGLIPKTEEKIAEAPMSSTHDLISMNIFTNRKLSRAFQRRKVREREIPVERVFCWKAHTRIKLAGWNRPK